MEGVNLPRILVTLASPPDLQGIMSNMSWKQDALKLLLLSRFGTQQVHSVMLPTHCQSFTTERKERPCQAVFGPEGMDGRGSSGQQPFMSGTVFTHTLFKGLCVFWMHFIRVWAPPRFFHLTFGDRLLQPWEGVTLPNRSDRCSAELGGKMCF